MMTPAGRPAAMFRSFKTTTMMSSSSQFMQNSPMPNLSSLPRWSGLLDSRPMPTGPFVADLHSFDIPTTVAACIRNAVSNCIGIVLVDRGGPEMRAAAELAAKERGIIIIWEDCVVAAEEGKA
jgi:hypothetical protein